MFGDVPASVIISMGGGLLGMLFATYLAMRVLRQDPGNDRMQEISGAVQEGATARRDDSRTPVDQPRDHPPLAVPEMRLAEPLEYLPHAEPRRSLDLRIRVGERQAEPLREPAADRRLAGPRQAEEEDWLFPSFRFVGHAAGAIQGAPGWGKRRAMPKYSFAPQRRRRNPVGLIFLLILVLLIGFLVWLGLRSTEVPQQRIEQDVTNALPPAK